MKVAMVTVRATTQGLTARRGGAMTVWVGRVAVAVAMEILAVREKRLSGFFLHLIRVRWLAIRYLGGMDDEGRGDAAEDHRAGGADL